MTDWLTRRSQPGLVALLLLAVTFAVGGLTGAALNQAVGAREAPAEATAAEPPTEQPRRSIFDGLGLTEAQRAHVDAVLAERRHRLETLWREHEPRMHAVMEETNARINEVLTPDQVAELERRRAERRERRAAEQRAQDQHRRGGR
jgi:Spy/CpxP family protein refolding chaperone